MITVPKIQLALRNDTFKSTEVSVPNIFLWPPFESDFVRVTKSGYAIEYEIKLSKSDFKADFKKAKTIIDHFDFKEETHNGSIVKRLVYKSLSKHDWLLSGKGATEFYYVFPLGLINHEEVPEWAGIIEVEEYKYFGRDKMSVGHRRKAKRLNREPLSEAKKKDIYVSCYYRYWDVVNGRISDRVLIL